MNTNVFVVDFCIGVFCILYLLQRPKKLETGGTGTCDVNKRNSVPAVRRVPFSGTKISKIPVQLICWMYLPVQHLHRPEIQIDYYYRSTSSTGMHHDECDCCDYYYYHYYHYHYNGSATILPSSSSSSSS